MKEKALKVWEWIKSKWVWFAASIGLAIWYFTKSKVVDKQIAIKVEEMKEHETRAEEIQEQREILTPQLEQAKEEEITARTRVKDMTDQELADSFIRMRGDL